MGQCNKSVIDFRSEHGETNQDKSEQRQDAEDTMQELLLKSVASLPKFGSPKALMVWLYRVAKNRCLMSRRKSKFAPKKNLSLEEQSKLRKDYQWKRKRARAEVLV